MTWELPGCNVLSTWLNLESSGKGFSVRDYLYQVRLCARLWEAVLIKWIDTGKPSPVWAAPFPRQDVLTCVRVGKSVNQSKFHFWLWILVWLGGSSSCHLLLWFPGLPSSPLPHPCLSAYPSLFLFLHLSLPSPDPSPHRSTGVTDVHYSSWLSQGAWDLNSGPHTCTLLTKLSPVH